ncbi:anaerobic ribonucleoside-triphosphate reductase activating protein [Prevotella sp. HUN102]|uniref:anaerobic ribonucleoside-triphosphate reductase activating protein n=1 Tax=Prevotella sp. HUN102 TaxID=1392486 RepID=UPI00048B871D|nr:anaerobic ribonucleoside-triphosphate reductase activating protein [Prevotella sp. HUN102]
MLKYINSDIVFQEFPDEVTLAINLSNCPCRCPGCHSTFLWKDVGELLTIDAVETMLQSSNNRLTCLGIMGGDAEPDAVNVLAKEVRERHPELKIGWYTGRTMIASQIEKRNFDYIKVGPYIKHLGGLDSRKTNQRMYRVGENGSLEDITNRFWQNKFGD